MEYTDAWGVVLSTSGTLAGTLGNDNPFRYRGYYYDAEIELYYLQSRYYSPEWGRFINADTTEGLEATRNILIINLFAYCINNPVCFDDPTGKRVDIGVDLNGKTVYDTDYRNCFVWPVPYRNYKITAFYPTYPSGGAHSGIDIVVENGCNSYGKNIVAAKEGKVIASGTDGSYGNCIKIDCGNRMIMVYAHCKTLLVNKNKTVTKGQLIATIGHTGNTKPANQYGSHLHFEIRIYKTDGTYNRVNPLQYRYLAP